MKIGLIFFLLLSAARQLIAAQDPAPAPSLGTTPGAHLSLREALDLATRQNLELSAARLKRAVSAAEIRIASQRPNPSVAFSGSRDTPHESVSIGQSIEIGGKRGQRMEVARQEGGLTELEITDLERQVRRQAREAYYSAALRRAITAQRERGLDLARQVQGVAQARFDAGDIPQLEVLQTALEVSRAEADWKVAQQEEQVAFSRFNALVNEPPGRTWDLLGELEALPPQVALNDLIGKATGANPGLLHLAQEARLEQSRQMLLRVERIPNLNFEFGLDFNAPEEFQFGPRAQISLDLPLFSRNQGEIAQSLATERRLESSAAATRRSVAGQVEAGYYELAARRAEVALYRESVLPASRRLAGLAQESYSAGRSPIMTVLDAQRSAQALERDYLDSVFALQSAFAELEETVAVPLD